MKRSRDFFVGLFSLAAVVIFVIFTISLQDIDFFNRTAKYYVTFKSVYKLAPGASVLVFGVKEGTVSNIESISGPSPVLVTIKIDKSVKLYTDAKISVTVPGVIGTTTVDIDSGGGTPGALPVEPDHQFAGIEAVDFNKMVGDLSVDLRDVAEELQKTLVSINSIISDPENQKATKELLRSLGSTTVESEKTLHTLNEQLEPTLTELRAAVERANKFLENATALSTQLSGDAATVKKSVVAAVDQWKNTGASAEKEFAETARSIRSASEKLNGMIDAMQHGEGSVARLINDPRPFDDLRQAIAALNRALTGARESLMPPVSQTPRPRQREASPTPRSTPQGVAP